MKSLIHLDCTNWHVNIFYSIWKTDVWWDYPVGLRNGFTFPSLQCLDTCIHLSWILWKAENPPDGRRKRVVMIFSVGRLEGMQWWGGEQNRVPCLAEPKLSGDSETKNILSCFCVHTFLSLDTYMALQIFIVSRIKIQAILGPDKFNFLTDVRYDTLPYVGSFLFNHYKFSLHIFSKSLLTYNKIIVCTAK